MRKTGIEAIVLSMLIVLPGAASAQLAAPSASSFGLAGSFAARARGYEASYWNPANLGLPGAPGWSVGIVGVNTRINNNALDHGLITGLFGEFIDSETKSRILAAVRRSDSGRFRLGGELGASALAVSIGRFGFGVSALGVGDLQVSPDAAELILFGNVGEDGTGKDFDFRGNGDGSVLSNVYLSYAQPFSFASLAGMEFAIGASAKYGIAHALALVTDGGSTFTVNPLVLQPDVQIISSTGWDAGRIWAFDLGAALEWSNWAFSLALQNAFANVNWNVEDFELSLYEGRADITGAVLTDTTIAYSDLTLEQQQPIQDRLERADPPRRLRMGALYRLGQAWTLSADYMELTGGTLREQWDRSLSLGAQVTLISVLPLRAGLATDFSQITLAGGLGVYVGPVHVDFSYSTLTLGAGDGAIASLSISVWPGVSSRQP
jgi:hypothetical protein